MTTLLNGSKKPALLVLALAVLTGRSCPLLQCQPGEHGGAAAASCWRRLRLKSRDPPRGEQLVSVTNMSAVFCTEISNHRMTSAAVKTSLK